MSINDAADMLQERLEKSPWVTGIGAGATEGGAEAIFIYTNASPPKASELERLVKEGWMGFDVVIERVGKSRPLSA